MYEKELNFAYFENLDKWRETYEDNEALREDNTELRAFLSELSERAEIARSEIMKDPYNIKKINELIVLLDVFAEGLAKKNDTKKISQIC